MNITYIENLYLRNLRNENTEEGSALYDLFNPENKGWLDKSDAVKEILKNNYSYCDEMQKEMSGDILNSFRTVFERYIKDVLRMVEGGKFKGNFSIDYKKSFEENKGKFKTEKYIKNITLTVTLKNKENEKVQFEKEIEISEKASLYFYLTTTIGNIMSWIRNGNYVCGRGLDIAYYKLDFIYRWIDFVSNGENKAIIEQRKRKFISRNYLQDFVENEKTDSDIDIICGVTPKKVLNPLKAKDWDEFFFENSKAIIMRGYRVLKKENLTKDDLTCIEETFKTLCENYKIEDRDIEILQNK